MTRSMNPFKFVTPTWLNGPPAETSKERLLRAHTAAQAFYAVGVQTGIHSMIEWCGVMTEYVSMLSHVSHTQGIGPEHIDQHSRLEVKVPEHMVNYFCEKLGCQLKPFIHGDPELWRAYIDQWFKK